MARNNAIAVAVLVGTGWLATATDTAAQVNPTPSSSPAFRIPTLMVSAGLGTANDPRGAPSGSVKPMQTISVQFMPTRHLVVEGEFGRWDATWDYRVPNRIFPPGGQATNGEFIEAGSLEGWSAGVNLLYRTEPRRMSAFVGGGPFAGSERYAHSTRLEGCVPQPVIRERCASPSQYEYQETNLRFQAVAGADVQIAGPVRAYGALQFTTMDHAYVRTSGGVRVVAHSRRAVPRAASREPGTSSISPSPDRQTELRGKQVRVTLADGSRTQSRFVSIDAGALITEKGGRDQRYSLDQIVTVETVHKTARRAAIIGAIAGFVGGYVASCGGGDEETCWPEIGALFAGIGAGGGALIGAAYDHARASQHVIYSRGAGSGARLTPLATRGGGGVGVAIGF